MTLNRCLLFFVCGVIPLLYLPKLLSGMQWVLLFAIFITLSIFPFRYSRLLAVFLFGFLWANLWAMIELNKVEYYSHKQFWAEGYIESIYLGKQPYRVAFRVTNKNGQTLAYFNQVIFSLTWSTHHNTPLAGQKWRILLSTRPLHGNLNEGGFDLQRWGIAQKQAITAKIKSATCLQATPHLRQRIISDFIDSFGFFEHFDVMIALLFGERGLLTKEKKIVFQYTGVAHLMAISGLHIMFSVWLGRLFVRGVQLFLPTYWINDMVPWGVGGVIALIYVWLSGGNTPALRAIVGLFFFLYFRWRSWRIGGWQLIIVIVASLLFINPLFILSDSFWLSICAVISLYFLIQCCPLTQWLFLYQPKWLIQLLYIQIGLFCLMMPIQILFFGGISFCSLITNLVAIPLISFIALPLLFLSLLLSPFMSQISHQLLLFVDISLNYLIKMLSYFDVYWIHLPNNYLVLGCYFWWLALSYYLHLFRYPVQLLCCMVVLCSLFLPDKKQSWRVDFLDVGQGLAIVIRQGQEAIIYDTASRWKTGSFAEHVIMPFLSFHQLSLIGVIISHEDNDHIGGLPILEQNFPHSWLRSSTTTLRGLPCIAGETWRWKQLEIEVLWPMMLANRAYNKDSCVLRVSDGIHQVLLTGDIEKQQEREIIESVAQQSKLSSTILQVPHHGSKTSSTELFIRVVKPELAIFSNARFNQWGMPAQKVVDRYERLHISHLTTGEEGQISLVFSGDQWQVYTYRKDISPRWYHDLFGDSAKTR